MKLTPEQKARWVEVRSQRVWTPFANALLEEMDQCRMLSQSEGGEPLCLLVYGDTGAGKTEIITRYRNEHCRQEKSDGSIIPVMYASLPANMSECGLIINILKDINNEIEDYSNKEFEDLVRVLVDYVRDLGIELFIIDEAQGFLEHESRRLIWDATEAIKRLIIATKRPFYLFGMPWCVYAIEQNPQLAGRLARRRYLEPFRISKDEDREKYLIFLDTLDTGLGFAKKAGLKKEAIALRLFVVSRGNLRALRNVIDQAALLAIIENSDQIAYHHFTQACQTIFPNNANPFTQKNLKKIEFVELAEPSYWNPTTKRGTSPIIEETYTEKSQLSNILVSK